MEITEAGRMRETTMRFTAILFSILLLFPATVTAQAHKTAKSAKKITLDEVLGCSEDEWLVAAWKASILEMNQLSALALVVNSNKNKVSLDSKISLFPFVAGVTAENKYFLMPKNLNDKADEEKFCHSNVHVIYVTPVTFEDYKDSKPVVVTIDVDDEWTFDFSQVLRHADQFTWESGVFSDSADSYLSAIKGNCRLQFLVSTGVAKLYRVTFKASDAKSQ